VKSERLKQKSFSISNFKQLLQEELVERCRTNPNYSLRSFARSLRVEPSALSQIINGKRPLTQKMKLRLGAALGMSATELKKYTRDDDSGNPKVSHYQQLTLDSFAIISDWYHYAILELTHTEGFRPDPAWISKRLGITKSEVNVALERLFRLELLEKTSNGQWVDASENGVLSHLKPGVSSDAARKYQCQLLELSKSAVQEIPVSKRNHTSATFSFDPEDLPRAIERISEFRRSFAVEFQPKNKGKEVYQIQISFFPLTSSSSSGVST
jgi:transcriptional regulator with XRE-family HTH domain